METPIENVRNSPPTTWLKVTSGKYRGKTVRLVKWTEKCAGVVVLEDGRNLISPSSLSFSASSEKNDNNNDDHHRQPFKIIYLPKRLVQEMETKSPSKMTKDCMWTTNDMLGDPSISSSAPPTMNLGCETPISSDHVSSSSHESSSSGRIINDHRNKSQERAPSSNDNNKQGLIVKIVNGKHKGKWAVFIKRTPQRIGVQLLVDPNNNGGESSIGSSSLPPTSFAASGKTIYLIPHHVDTSFSTCSSSPDSDNGGADEEERNNDSTISRAAAYTACNVGQYQDEDYVNVQEPTMLDEEEDENESMEQDWDDYATAVMDEDNDDNLQDNEDRNKPETSIFDTTASTDRNRSTKNEDSQSKGDNEQQEQKQYSPGEQIVIQSGSHANKTAIFVKYTDQRIGVRLLDDADTNRVRYLNSSSLIATAKTSRVSSSSSNDPFCQALRAQLDVSPPSIVELENCTAAKRRQTLMGTLLRDTTFVEISGKGLQRIPKLPRQLQVETDDGTATPTRTTYCLIATKRHVKERTLTCAYRPTEKHENVTRTLLQIGAFDRLPAHKTAARLELLLSKAATLHDEGGSSSTNARNKPTHHIHAMSVCDFELIPEAGNDGCGFIPRRILNQLLSSSRHEQKRDDVSSIQVRIVAPALGIFKGLLAEKPGIDSIQLPPSMKKVEASSCPAASDGHKHGNIDHTKAYLLINQTGIFPYPTRVQQAYDNFQDRRLIPEQAKWMLIQKGVSNSYLEHPNRQHANLIGQADPTNGGIPSGCIFITGITRSTEEFTTDFVVISRFPMTEASDGRVIPVLKARPPTMSVEHWNFLCSMKFGSVIFGQPPPGQCSLPETIAQGDLDGDGYFVCWDEAIVTNALIGDKPILANKSTPQRLPSSWWKESLDYMTDLQCRSESLRLIGALCTMWKRRLNSNLLQESLMFGRAYKEALVVSKHGGQVTLPSELWQDLPYTLRKYLKPP